MQTRLSTVPKRTTPPSAANPERTQGFTLIELLLAMALFLVVVTIAMNAFTSSNRLIETDTGRIAASQNVRSALDILVADVRQAGEYLDLTLGVSGVEFNNTTDRLTVRRTVPPQTDATGTYQVTAFPICQISGGRKIVTVAIGGNGSCPYVPYTPSDPNAPTANTKAWSLYFAAQGNRPQAGILAQDGSSPLRDTIDILSVAQTGSLSGTTDTRTVTLTLRTALPTGYSVTSSPRIQLVDERRYRVADGNLLLALGGQSDDEAQTVAFDISDFTVSANLIQTATQNAENVESMGLKGQWSRVGRLQISLSGGSTGQGSSKTRTYSATVFPRNVESAK